MLRLCRKAPEQFGKSTNSHLAASVHWGPFPRCPCNKSLALWGLYQGR